MKSIEIEKQIMQEAEEKKKYFWKLFTRFGDEEYFEAAREQAKVVQSIKEKLERAERAQRLSMDYAIKTSLIEMTAYEAGIEKVLVCAGTSPTTATAIIDEIIESDFDAEAKLLIIKMFLDNLYVYKLFVFLL